MPQVSADRDGVLRPQGSAFGVGAYEAVDGGVPCYNFEPPPRMDIADLQAVAGHCDGVSPALPDYNGNGCVDLGDVMEVAGLWGTVTNDPRYDLYPDGCIAVVDIMQVVAR